jgi:phosphohistidine phosphatase
MLKTLLIMRHAKSSWSDGSLTDHQRPLNKRGRRDATTMATFLREKNLVPELIVHSSAMRTTLTCELMCETFKIRKAKVPESRSRDDLYLAPAETYLDIAWRLNDSLETVLLLGHNPGIEEFVAHVSGHYEVVPTATIACFTTGADSWSKIDVRDFELFGVWRPKEI